MKPTNRFYQVPLFSIFSTFSTYFFILFLLFSFLFCVPVLCQNTDSLLCKGDIKNSLREGKWQCFSANDILLAEGSYKNNQKNGLWTYYDEKGFVIMAMQFENDEPNGYCRKYVNRKFVYECYYKNGKKDGFESVYYPDGSLQGYYFYMAGEIHKNNLEYFGDNITASNVEFFCGDKRGETKLYYKNAKPELSLHYIHNELEGEWLLSYPDEKPQIKGTFKDDSIYYDWTKYDANGEKAWEIYFNRGEADKKWTRRDLLANYTQIHTYDSGKLQKVSDWIAQRDKLSGGRLKNGNGERYWYDHNKCLKAKGMYQNGELHGLYWLYANCSIKEIAVFNYQNNVLQGEYSFKYANGKNSVLGYFANNVVDSSYQEFFEDGQLALEGQYQKGIKVGEWIAYYKTGKMHTKETYIENELQGISQTFYEDGTTMSESFTYQNGLKNGKAFSYFRNGTIAAEGEYKDNEQEGLWKFYDQAGKLTEQGTYVAGLRQDTWQTFLATGEIASEGKYKNDAEDSVWLYYHTKGWVTEEESWKEGRMLQAKQIFYKRKGKIKGEWTMFGKNSTSYVKYYDWKRKKLAVKGVMKDGLPQSTWKFYDKKGNKTMEGNFDNGLRNGKWKFYAQEKLTIEGNYLQGQKIGEWKYFDQKGKIEKTEMYE